MTHRLTGVFLVVMTALAAVWAHGEPLRVVNASPVARIAGPPAPEPARLLTKGHSAWSVAMDWASNATVSSAGAEEILLDGESLTLTGRWRRGNGRWQWGADLSYVLQGGGVLDNIIDGYHDLFGFPEGDRPQLEDDRLVYIYNRAGSTLLDIDGHSDGIGDVRLVAAWQAYRDEARAVSLHAELKLPTGDSDNLIGSGGTDLALGANGAWQIGEPARAGQIYAGFGLLIVDEGDVLAELRERNVWFAHAGIAWSVHPSLTVNLQFDAHDALYDSDLPELGDALQISVGGVWEMTPGWELGMGVVEDISTHSAPDVVFHFDLRRRAQ